jgi:PBP1b-binding outer membrane lipoprotein LpoB
MKKLLLLLAAAMLIAGCTSEFYKHDSVFKTNDHVAFSWWGYNKTTSADAKLSAEQGWWGKEIPYIPAK